MSDKLKGLFLEEGANLTQQGVQNLRTFTRGDLTYSNVKWALRQLDSSAGAERLLPGKAGAGSMLAAASEDLGS
eukprot:3732882-Pyramimonas_sp.AAC.1